MKLPLPISHIATLRLVAKSDAADLAAAYLKNREHLAPWDPTRHEKFFTTKWHEDDIAVALEGDRAGATLPLVIATRTAIIGRVTLSRIVRGPLQSAVLGYWIDCDETGKGLMAASVEAVLEVARDELGLHRIEAGTLVHNVASQRVLVRAGFEYFGMAPKYLRIAGQWQDHKLFQVVLHD